jgi:ATP-dependent DNA helicase DinG
MQLTDYFSAEAIAEMRAEIADAGGNEVFFAGWRRGKRVIVEVEVLARGDDRGVPALLQASRRADAVIHNHPSGVLTPSPEDLEIAAELGFGGVGFLIVDNEVRKVYACVEMIRDRTPGELDPEEVERLLHADGPIAARVAGFERRREQLAMLREVVAAFNKGRILIVEAGTGTGKSMAYLVPALLWAARNKERCVVSTGTINLQQQLIEKDIPLLVAALDVPVKFTLVKGRGNYICLLKLTRGVADQRSLFDDREMNDLEAIRKWAQQTADGSRSDLSFVPSWELWEKLSADGDTCLFRRCPHYKDCFLMQARRRASSADLLVVNHHLLFADLALRRAGAGYERAALLPAYQRLILDEAHKVEDAASSYFGKQVTALGLRRTVRRIYRTGRRREQGLVPVILRRLKNRALARELQEAFAGLHQRLIEDLEAELDQAPQRMLHYLRENAQRADSEWKLRLKPETYFSDGFQEEIAGPLHSLLTALRRLVAAFKEWVSDLDDLGSELELERKQLQAQVGRLTDACNALSNWIELEDDGQVRWIEARERSRGPLVRWIYAPLEVGPILLDTLYSRLPTLVLTSATMTADGAFTFMEERLGLNLVEDRKVAELRLPPTFDYRRQLLLGLPTDLPDPNSRKFREALAEATLRLLEVTGGRAFVLFTSFALLNYLYNQLEPRLVGMGITPLRQGSGDRHRLLERFKSDISSTLFGTDSFWEGVDAPGSTLECVILTRLPFRVPSEPIIEARVEAIKRAGRNAFAVYTLPQAIIKFKQGFGRLIRKRDDHGVVVVFDRRVVEKSYGRSFLRSLPDCRMVQGRFNTILREVREFLGNR